MYEPNYYQDYTGFISDVSSKIFCPGSVTQLQKNILKHRVNIIKKWVVYKDKLVNYLI